MVVYRVCKTKFSKDLSGEGARLNGGRWNHIDTPCIYTSESRALAIIEYSVNVNIDDIPRSLSITTIEIPDNEIQILSISDLPGNWQESPAPTSTKDLGTNLLENTNSLIIKIPSAIIPNEYNYLLNPLNPGSRNFKILHVADFIYDVRIKSV